MKEIFIFDIDGCILGQIFPNIYENINFNENLMEEALKKSEYNELFEEFVNFYRENCQTAYQVFFITGRQKSYFGMITEKQLAPLKTIRIFKIIYFPEDKSHTAGEYFNWKIEKISEIFKKYYVVLKNNKNSKNNLIFKIFDDMTEHFDDINRLARNFELKISLKPIKGPEDWILRTK